MAKTPVRQEKALDELAAAQQPWWRRYSPHGEFPWSSSVSVALHLFLILLIAFAAAMTIKRDPTPPAVDVAEVVEGETEPSGMGDAAAEDEGTLEESAEESKSEPLPPAPSTEVEQVDTQDVPLEPVEFAEGQDAQVYERQMDDIKNKLEEARARRQKLANHFQNQRKSGGSGKTPGGAGSGEGGRAARWILRFNLSSPRDYLTQLDGLGATVAFPAEGDKWRYFYNPSGSNRRSELRDLGSENRVYWIDNNSASVARVASFLGIPPPSFMVAFLPPELENRMLQLELAYKGLKEEEIRSTQFECIRRGGKLDVIVVGQTPR
ncbi:MAG: hypothetical protein JXB10_04105 [Pirellulales bacterium]|nr:hypothetical protein [Pirellulales bacterium]